jgi:hypothetical protein
MSAAITFAPSLAKEIAASCPIPEPAPLTKQTLPANLLGIGSPPYIISHGFVLMSLS